MRFAPLRLAQRTYASCAPAISLWSFKHLSAISGRQYGQISRSARHASARLTVSAISWRGALHSVPYRGAVYRGAATSGGPVRAISVRSACSSIGWSSSVVFPCCGSEIPDRRAGIVPAKTRKVTPLRPSHVGLTFYSLILPSDGAPLSPTSGLNGGI